MTEIYRNIEKEIKRRNPKNTIFKGYKFHRNITLPFFIILFLLFIPYFIIEFPKFREVYRFPYLLFLLLFVYFYFYCFINPFAKKQLMKNRIIPDKGFFKHWANKNYFEYKYNSFRKYLIDSKMLTVSDTNTNQKLLKEYSDFFKSEAEKLKAFEVFKIIGGLFLAFIIPLWNQFLGKIFRLAKENEIEIETALKLSSQFLLFIFIGIMLISYIKYMLKEILETRKRRLHQISNELLNLKWNEELRIKNSKYLKSLSKKK